MTMGSRLRSIEPVWMLAVVLLLGALFLWLTVQYVPEGLLVLTALVVGWCLGYQRSRPAAAIEPLPPVWVPEEGKPA
jgi:hypothetical protein